MSSVGFGRFHRLGSTRWSANVSRSSAGSTLSSLIASRRSVRPPVGTRWVMSVSARAWAITTGCTARRGSGRSFQTRSRHPGASRRSPADWSSERQEPDPVRSHVRPTQDTSFKRAGASDGARRTPLVHCALFVSCQFLATDLNVLRDASRLALILSFFATAASRPSARSRRPSSRRSRTSRRDTSG